MSFAAADADKPVLGRAGKAAAICDALKRSSQSRAGHSRNSFMSDENLLRIILAKQMQ